jgi:cell division protein FtsL
MDQLENLARTYNQAPWRKQLQWIALFMLIIVMVAIVAGIYLNISVRATAVGRDIQSMQSEIDDFNRENEDLQTQIARILSSENMEARAREMGFEPVDQDEIVYLRVPGYTEQQPVLMAPLSERTVVSAVSVPPEYTESIFEWIVRNYQDWYRTVTEEIK